MGNFYRLFGSKEVATNLTKLKVAVFLSLLFVSVYSTCNYLSSIRTDVGELYFTWEAAIPLIPILIIPYMSIDLFFVGAPFLCSTKKELILFSKRVALGIFIAGAFFLIMPLQFAFERPIVEGVLGPVFTFLHGFDQPYNLFPSLHIILRTILAHKYAEKTQGWLRTVVHIWFILIGFSTIFIYQHHILDVVSGFVVALLIFYFIREEPSVEPRTKNYRMGSYYIVLFLVSIIILFCYWPWSAFILWLPLALLVMTVGYFGFGSAIVNKVGGKIDLPSRLVLVPWFLGQRLSLIYYSRQCNRWDKVTPSVWVGQILNKEDSEQAIKEGVSAVVDMTCEFSEADSFTALDKQYLNIKVLDLTAPSISSLDKVADFIIAEEKQGIVYVHCKIGYSRSVAAAGAYLLKSKKATTVDDAIDMIRTVRPSIVVRPEISDVLKRYKKFISEAYSEE